MSALKESTREVSSSADSDEDRHLERLSTKDNNIVLFPETHFDLPESDFTDFDMKFLDKELDFTYNDSLIQQTLPSLPLSLPTTLSYTIRSFNTRPKLNPSTQRTTTLILHILKSYPLIVMRDNALPPFIHPHALSLHADNLNMEPLNNCLSLMQMLKPRNNASRKLFWTNVKMECQRLSASYEKLNEWELLAGMQALSVYILIRLDEGEMVDNNVDILLVTTVIVSRAPHSHAGVC